MFSEKNKFYKGELGILPTIVTQKMGKVSKSVTMEEAMELLGLPESEIRSTYSTYKLDNATFVQL